MLETLKEHWREAKAVLPLKAEWKQTCPADGVRTELMRQFRRISREIPCPHNESHILSFVVEMFRIDAHDSNDGVFVEAGCYMGGSTAKFSLVAHELGRKLVVFDSFKGLPTNTENHKQSIFGYSIKNWFREGEFRGPRDVVTNNISRYGKIDVCEFVEGWFEETLPHFDRPILGAYIDVDLASSTRTCLKNIYPRIVPGGVLVSQDGDFPLIIDVFRSRKFWENEVGVSMPEIQGLGTSKMLRIVKS